jgi:hypothetical protein
MRLFALETNPKKLEASLLSSGEEVVLRVTFHPFLFIMRSCRAIAMTILFFAIESAAFFFGAPVLWTSIALIAIWIPFTLFPWITAYIDWRYDVLIVTNEEVVFVDQSSLFHIKIRQMNLDNVASVSAESQFWNIFPFGKIHFDLKEGVGSSLTLRYIPHAQKVASMISDTEVRFQRRRSTQNRFSEQTRATQQK